MHSCKVIHTTAEKLDEELAAFFTGKTVALSSITQSSAFNSETGNIYVTVIIIYG